MAFTVRSMTQGIDIPSTLLRIKVWGIHRDLEEITMINEFDLVFFFDKRNRTGRMMDQKQETVGKFLWIKGDKAAYTGGSYTSCHTRCFREEITEEMEENVIWQDKYKNKTDPFIVGTDHKSRVMDMLSMGETRKTASKEEGTHSWQEQGLKVLRVWHLTAWEGHDPESQPYPDSRWSFQRKSRYLLELGHQS